MRSLHRSHAEPDGSWLQKVLHWRSKKSAVRLTYPSGMCTRCSLYLPTARAYVSTYCICLSVYSMCTHRWEERVDESTSQGEPHTYVILIHYVTQQRFACSDERTRTRRAIPSSSYLENLVCESVCVPSIAAKCVDWVITKVCTLLYVWLWDNINKVIRNLGL